MAEWDRVETLLSEWIELAGQREEAHSLASNHYAKWNYGLGLPVVVLSTVVGTTVFASLQSQSESGTMFKVIVGAVSVLAAVLAGVQTFLDFGKRAEKHHIVSVGYGDVRLDMQQIVALPVEDRGKIKECLESMSNRMDALAKESPDVPNRVWKRMLSNRARPEKTYLPAHELSKGTAA